MKRTTKTKANNDDISDLAKINFTADIKPLEVAELERIANDPQHGRARRLALSILSRDKAFIVSNMVPDDTGEVWLDAAEDLKAYRKHLTGMASLVQTAEARCMCIAAFADRRAEAANAKGGAA